ncbi:MAG: hypothetical protein Kow0029_01790 [Candidatus Rifleibacteriota bacterium]
MELLKERVSAIVKSPVILKLWHFSYRQVIRCGLVLLLVTLSMTLPAENDKVTRFNLVSAIYERVYNRQVTELEAINTGLLDAYDDGKFHLDWPVSRGMAAEAFYRLSIQSGTAAKLPRAFADVNADSPYKKILDVVGGAFLPQRRGNFDANHMLSRHDLFRGIQILVSKGVFKQEDRYEMDIEIINRPVESVASAVNSIEEFSTVSIRPELGFEERNSSEEKFKRDAYQRFSRANRQVAAEQLNPQIMASVEDATNAMADVESIMKNLGGSVLEMTSTYPSNPDDEKALRQGLAKIEGVLKSIIDRFEYSKLQLGTVMPVEPDQIVKCAELEKKLNRTIEEASILRKRISARLAEPQKD